MGVPSQDFGKGHIALCDMQAVEKVQTTADPQEKARQLHTYDSIKRTKAKKNIKTKHVNILVRRSNIFLRDTKACNIHQTREI